MEALVFLGFVALPPGQPIVNVGPKAGPQKEACQQDDDQQDHEGVRACAFCQPGGHAEGGGPTEQKRYVVQSTAGPWVPGQFLPRARGAAPGSQRPIPTLRDEPVHSTAPKQARR